MKTPTKISLVITSLIVLGLGLNVTKPAEATAPVAVVSGVITTVMSVTNAPSVTRNINSLKTKISNKIKTNTDKVKKNTTEVTKEVEEQGQEREDREKEAVKKKQKVIDTAQKIWRVVTESNLRWANGGFEGKQGFLGDWKVALRNKDIATFTSSLQFANSHANILAKTDGVDPESIAEQNWVNYQTQELQNARLKTEALNKFAAKELKTDTFEDLVKGSNATLPDTIGENNVNSFLGGDIYAGGWDGIVDAGNWGANTLPGQIDQAEGALAEKATEERGLEKLDFTTPEKYYSKDECLLEKKDAEGKKTGECLVRDTKTPAAQVSARVDKALDRTEETLKTAKTEGDLKTVINASVQKELIELLKNTGLRLINQVTSNLDGGFTASSYTSNFTLGLDSNDIEDTLDDTLDFDDFTDTDDDLPPFQESRAQILKLPTLIHNQELLSEHKIATEKSLSDLITYTALLDTQLPGPDYGWEDRYDFYFESPTFLDLEKMEQTKTMINDKSINIPGASQARLVVDTLVENVPIISDDLEYLLSENIYIKNITTKASETLNAELAALDGYNLVLLQSDWDALTEGEKIAMFNTAIEENYYSLKDDETATSYVTEKPAFAFEIIKTLAWDLLFDNISEPEVLALYQQSIYLEANSFSEDEFFELELIIEEIETLKNDGLLIYTDLVILKYYALGKSVAWIESHISDTAAMVAYEKDNSNHIGDVSETILSTEDGILVELVMGVSFGGRSDNNIKDFLDTQREQQISGEDSVLKTDLFTSVENINNSILGFDDIEDRLFHFVTTYNDEENDTYFKNAMSIATLFENNIALVDSNISEVGGIISRVFCPSAHKTYITEEELDDDFLIIDITTCAAPWSKTTMVEYMTLFSGI